MIISNLAAPDWISISCDEKLLMDVVCVFTTGNNDMLKQSHIINKNSTMSLRICSRGRIKQKERCYNFLWQNCEQEKCTQKSMHNKCHRVDKKAQVEDIHNCSNLDFLHEAIEVRMPPFIYMDGLNVSILKEEQKYGQNYFRNIIQNPMYPCSSGSIRIITNKHQGFSIFGQV